MNVATRVSLLALALLVACKSGSDAPAAAAANTRSIPDGKTPSALVSAVDSATLASMEMRKGEWKEADASSQWRAWVANGKVRVIEEFMAVGDYSARKLMHYYTDDEKLAAHLETRDQLVFAGDRPPVREQMTLTLEFQGNSATKSSKIVNNVEKSVEPFEVETAKSHGEVLLAAAKSAAAVTPTPAKP
ncbi:MAG: hypothetical protein ABJB66_08490 [Gemmatimonadaceae bacterium]